MNNYSGSGCWSMGKKVVYTSPVLLGKESRKDFPEEKTKESRY